MLNKIKGIEEILELAKEEIENNDENVTATLDLEDLKALKSLYDLYQQEKEKNKELETYLKQYLDGELITAKQGKFFEKMVKENYVRKNKIKEKIEDYEKMIEGTFKDNTWYGQNRRDNCYEIIKVLKELLEGKQNDNKI